MLMNIKTAGLALSLGLSGIFVSGTVKAQGHPNYMHALGDLRTARWMLEHRPGNWQQSQDERAAEKEINDAIRDIKQAHIDDGRGIDEHDKWAEHNDRGGRLHDAQDLLRKARGDMDRAEDLGGLRGRILRHIDESLRFVDRAIHAKY
jgi:hypothetical protein